MPTEKKPRPTKADRIQAARDRVMLLELEGMLASGRAYLRDHNWGAAADAYGEIVRRLADRNAQSQTIVPHG